MKFSILDLLFILGVVLIILPIFFYSLAIGSVVTGVILVYLSLVLGRRSTNKERR